MFMTTAFAPDRADLDDLILDAPEKVLFCRIAADAPDHVLQDEMPDGEEPEDHEDEDQDAEDDEDDEEEEEDEDEDIEADEAFAR